MTQKDMFASSPEPSSHTPADAAPDDSIRLTQEQVDSPDEGGFVDHGDRHMTRGTLADSQDAREFYADNAPTITTLDQFQATRKHVDNIGTYSQDEFSDNRCGYVYADTFYIECKDSEELRTHGHNIDHDYYLIIGNQEHCSDNLAELEAILWNDFAKAELGVDDIPTITLKRVEYSQMNSTDSHCFGAIVLLDGKPFCEARDDGNGGEQVYSAIRPKAGWSRSDIREAAEAIDARIAEIDAALLIRDGSETTERGDGSSFTLPNNCFDYIICNLVNEWLAAKHLRRLLKKRVVYFTDGTIMETQCAKTKAQLAQWIADSKPEEGIILNNLSFDEALKLFREAK